MRHLVNTNELLATVAVRHRRQDRHHARRPPRPGQLRERHGVTLVAALLGAPERRRRATRARSRSSTTGSRSTCRDRPLVAPGGRPRMSAVRYEDRPLPLLRRAHRQRLGAPRPAASGCMSTLPPAVIGPIRAGTPHRHGERLARRPPRGDGGAARQRARRRARDRRAAPGSALPGEPVGRRRGGRSGLLAVALGARRFEALPDSGSLSSGSRRV